MKPAFGDRKQILAIQKKIQEFEYEKRLQNEDLIEYEYTIEVKCEGKMTGKFFALDNEDADSQLDKICENIDVYDVEFDESELEIIQSDFEETGKIQIAKNKQVLENQLNLFGA